MGTSKIVAGPGSRSPVKRDYEPRKILTFHPQVANKGILARLCLFDNLFGKIFMFGKVAQMVRAADS